MTKNGVLAVGFAGEHELASLYEATVAGDGDSFGDRQCWRCGGWYSAMTEEAADRVVFICSGCYEVAVWA